MHPHFQAAFKHTHVLLPVIHPINRNAALANAVMAIEANAPGVFLVDQGATEDEVLALVLEMRERFPKLWVGVNLLTRPAVGALAYALHKCHGKIDGIWSDDAQIEARSGSQLAQSFLYAREELEWPGLYFGGVAFKYQAVVAYEDLALAAQIAGDYMDVICTSGIGTGIAAHPGKLREMRVGTDAPIALASGVTIDNVHEYLPTVNAFLVGTGLEEKFGVFDWVKVKDLAQAIQSC